MNLLKSSKLNLNCIIFTTENFPIDSPGGRRISNLIDKGLLNNFSSALITFEEYNKSYIYKFPLTLNYKNLFTRKSFFIKFLLFPITLSRFFLDLLFLFAVHKIEYIYIYSRLGIFTVIISTLGRIFNSHIVIDCTEWFSYKELNGLINKFQEYIHRSFSMKLSDHFYVIGRSMYKLINKKYPSKKITLIYPNPPLFIIKLIKSVVKENINKERKIKTLLYAGSFKEGDDPFLLFNNLINLSKIKDFRLVIISKNLVEKSISKKLYKKISILKNNLKNNFYLHGYLDNEDYFKVINLSDIILLPRSNIGYSKFNQPMRLSEYSLFNKKIITTNIDKEYQNLSKDIILYNPNEKNSFFTCINKILDL